MARTLTQRLVTSIDIFKLNTCSTTSFCRERQIERQTDRETDRERESSHPRNELGMLV